MSLAPLYVLAVAASLWRPSLAVRASEGLRMVRTAQNESAKAQVETGGCSGDDQCPAGYYCRKWGCWVKQCNYDAVLEKDVIIAMHAANSVNAINWAKEKGVNGLEIDFHFDAENQVSKVYHGCPSNCSVASSSTKDNSCEFLFCGEDKAEGAITILEAAASSNAIVMYWDSKLKAASTDEAFRAQGSNAARALVDHLFRKGFGGNVLMGCGGVTKLDFCQAAAKELEGTPYNGRVAFTFGGTTDISNLPGMRGQNGDPADAIRSLIQVSPYRMLSAGTSALFPKRDYQNAASRLGAENFVRGTLSSPPMMWTYDDMEEVGKLLQFYGARMITTDYPLEAMQKVQELGLQLPSSIAPFQEAKGSTMHALSDCLASVSGS